MRQEALSEIDGVTAVVNVAQQETRVSPPAGYHWYAPVKRLADFAAALCMGILLSPLLIVVSIAIYLDDPGPAIFRQQ